MANSTTVQFPNGQKTIPTSWIDDQQWHPDTKIWTGEVSRDGKRYEVQSDEQSVPVMLWKVKREIK